MIDIIFALIAAATPVQGADGQIAAAPQQTGAATVMIGESVQTGTTGILVEGKPAAGALPTFLAPETAAIAPAAAAGLVAEPQVATGKFTTAIEVKPILTATKANWIAVREYEGRDYLYFTHLLAWRCGLAAMAVSVNNEPMQNWPLPACHMEYAAPNAVLQDDGPIYLRFKLGSVQTVTIQITYDDLTTDVASFERGNVMIP